MKADSSSYNLLVLKLSDKSKQLWSVSSGIDKSADLALRQKWLTALQIHIDYASKSYKRLTELDAPASRSKLSWGLGGSQHNILPISKHCFRCT